MLKNDLENRFEKITLLSAIYFIICSNDNIALLLDFFHLLHHEILLNKRVNLGRQVMLSS